VAQRITATEPLPERRTRGVLARSGTSEAIYFAGWNGDALALASFRYDAETNAWHTGAPLPPGYGRMRPPYAVKQRPRVGNVLAFLDGALITVFGQDTTSPTPFAELDVPE